MWPDISLRYIFTIDAANRGHLGGARPARREPRSGYDIKRAVDRTIRHFWAASYGQIYPELKRLEAAGWIAGKDAPQGARARRVYTITAQGRASSTAGCTVTRPASRCATNRSCVSSSPTRCRTTKRLGLLAARREGYRMMLAYLQSLDDGQGAGSALRRSRLPLGARLLRMGNRMVRSAAAPLAPAGRDDLPEPTWRLDARARPAAVHRRGGRAGARLLRSSGGRRGSGRRSPRRRSSISHSRCAASSWARHRADRNWRRVRRHPGDRRARVAQCDGLSRSARCVERVVGDRVLRVRRDPPPPDRRVRERVVSVPAVVPRERAIQARVRACSRSSGASTAPRARHYGSFVLLHAASAGSS